ncbi:cyclase family protein [Micromonospora haikouensis]|uniref:cyclase family protein n=1 Tax=Micromonospora haikouensis TaxID=686309 RepID=UPI00379235FB
MTGRRRLVELSHVISDGMTTLPGWPAPRVTEWLTREASRANYAPGTEFQVGRIEMIANTGTYVDTPAHRWADGADLTGVGLDRLADLPGIVVRVPAGTRAVDRPLLARTRWRGGRCCCTPAGPRTSAPTGTPPPTRRT